MPDRVLWTFETESILNGGPAVDEEGVCYFGSRAGVLRAVDAAGALLWRFDAGGAIERCPCLHPEGLVLFGCYDGRLRALSRGGELAWELDLGHPVMTTPCVDEAGHIWVCDDGGHLTRVDVSGKGVARAPMADLLSSSPISVGERVLSLDQGLLWSDGASLPLGREPIVAEAAVGRDGSLYVGSWDGRLYAVQGDEIAWWVQLEGQIVAGCCVGPEGQVLVATRLGQVAAVSPDGSVLWKRKLEDGVHGSPAIAAQGVVFVPSADRKVHALALDTGKELWKQRCGRDLRSPLALTARGHLLVCCWDYKLYCIDGGAGGPAEAPWPQFHRDAARSGRAPG